MSCPKNDGGEHRWGKTDRTMMQRCACGAERSFPAHVAKFTRVPPQYGRTGLLVCKICGYVKVKGSPLGPVESRVHVEND